VEAPRASEESHPTIFAHASDAMWVHHLETGDFLYGSWNGRFTSVEPTVTRTFILGRRTATTAAQRGSVMALPLGATATPAGMDPAAYRATWDVDAKEHRVALTRPTSRN
jgi:hypothetical protein